MSHPANVALPLASVNTGLVVQSTVAPAVPVPGLIETVIESPTRALLYMSSLWTTGWGERSAPAAALPIVPCVNCRMAAPGTTASVPPTPTPATIPLASMPLVSNGAAPAAVGRT